jgi:3-hydroxypropionyl-coenzyme A dehydratase
MLVNRGIDSKLDTGLKLEIYSWSICFSIIDRKERMLKFLEKK